MGLLTELVNASKGPKNTDRLFDTHIIFDGGSGVCLWICINLYQVVGLARGGEGVLVVWKSRKWRTKAIQVVDPSHRRDDEALRVVHADRALTVVQ